MVATTEDITEGLGLSIQELADFFYTNDGLVASTHLERLRRTFYILSVLFDRAGLQANARKTVSMTCKT